MTAQIRGSKLDSLGDKPRVITDAQRLNVLEAVLADKSRLQAGESANLTRFEAEAIATCAGWSNRAMVQAARDRYKAEVRS